MTRSVSTSPTGSRPAIAPPGKSRGAVILRLVATDDELGPEGYTLQVEPDTHTGCKEVTW